MLTSPELAVPVTMLPVGSLPDSLLHVFDGVPDDQPWLQEALEHARMCATPLARSGLEALACEPLGAPVGPDSSRSLRVARATGLVMEEHQGTKVLQGTAVAHGCLYATWKDSAEGDVLAIEFQAPTAYGWGAGKDSLAQEQLMVRCLRQYERQVVSLLDGVRDAHLAAAISVAFEGEWDESTAMIQRRLAAACVTHWTRLCAAAVQPRQLMAA